VHQSHRRARYVATLVAVTCVRAALADTPDPLLIAPQTDRGPSPWENLELRVMSYPHLKFDMGALVAYRLDWIQVGLDYRGGHPTWALSRAPCVMMPVSVPIPSKFVLMPGVDMALRLDLPVVTVGAGIRPPPEMHLDFSVQLDPMLRALSPLLSRFPLTWLERPH
jgi:hypothetical protein